MRTGGASRAGPCRTPGRWPERRSGRGRRPGARAGCGGVGDRALQDDAAGRLGLTALLGGHDDVLVLRRVGRQGARGEDATLLVVLVEPADELGLRPARVEPDAVGAAL